MLCNQISGDHDAHSVQQRYRKRQLKPAMLEEDEKLLKPPFMLLTPPPPPSSSILCK